MAVNGNHSCCRHVFESCLQELDNEQLSAFPSKPAIDSFLAGELNRFAVIASHFFNNLAISTPAHFATLPIFAYSVHRLPRFASFDRLLTAR